MVWNALTDNLEVVWAALIAVVIVVLLTPAVGGMARHARRRRPARGGSPLHARRHPAARRPRALPRDLRARRSPSSTSNREMRGILLGAAIATTVGAVDDFRGLRWWEKLAGQVAAAAVVVWARRLGARASPSRFVGVQTLPKPGRDAR